MQLFVGVSTPLVWAATRPAPPGEEEVDVDVPDSASDLLEQQAGGGAAATTDPAGAATAPATPRTDASHPPALQQSASGRARADPYAAAAAAGALTDRDAWRRAPCLRVREVHELEQLVVRSQRKGKLRTAVVCPGFLYGRGEADGGLHPLMRQAWEVRAASTAPQGQLCHCTHSSRDCRCITRAGRRGGTARRRTRVAGRDVCVPPPAPRSWALRSRFTARARTCCP